MKSDYPLNSTWERLAEVITYSGLSVNAFAKAIGLKRSENLYQIKRGNNGISPKLAKRISRAFPCFSVAWLIFGEGVFEAEKPILFVNQPHETSIRIIPFYVSLDALKEKPEEPHPFHSSGGGAVPQCTLCHADDGTGQRKDRGDLPAVRQGSLGAGGQFRQVPYLRDDYKLQVNYLSLGDY